MPFDIDPILQALLIVHTALGHFKDYTKTTLDDTAYAILGVALSNKALLDLVRLIANDPEVVASGGAPEVVTKCADAHCNEAVLQETEAAGFSWTTFLTYLPLIIKLIQTVIAKRG